MKLTADDRARVNAAIREAESRNSADFVCVLTRNASDYEFYPLAWSALLAFLTPWALLPLTARPFTELLLAQLICFAAAMLILSQPTIRRLLVPRRVQRAAAHRAATEQFFIRGLANTPERRGVLLFVAHEERYARVLADDGAAATIEDEHWRKAVALLVADARRDRHADGFVAALAYCGSLADRAFPREGSSDVNALDDRFYVLDRS